MIRSAALACLAIVLMACGVGGPASTAMPSPTPSLRPLPTLSSDDLTQLAQLEKRPLETPAPAGDGECRQGPFTPAITPYANGVEELEPYGTGPVYGVGGQPIDAGPYVYFDVTYFTDPTVRGVVLIRVNDVSGKYPGRFVGPFAAGPLLGTDVIQNQQADVHAEVALPGESPPSNNPAPAKEWGIWHVRQGIDKRFTCAAIQIDTAAGTQVFLGH